MQIKRFFSLSLLLMMLTALSQPTFARESNRKEAFAFGLITGAIPIIGQFVAAFNYGLPGTMSMSEHASLITGHALGMSAWALPWYLVYRHYTSNK
jgi:peptidoglycan biosynthesis protein MviN/MurJ (putative lipid II flippase)